MRALDPESLKNYANEIGLNMPQFIKDMDSKDVKDQVDYEKAMGEMGLYGLPMVGIHVANTTMTPPGTSTLAAMRPAPNLAGRPAADGVVATIRER